MEAHVLWCKRKGGWMVVSVFNMQTFISFPYFSLSSQSQPSTSLISCVSLVHFLNKNKSLVFSGLLEIWLQRVGEGTWGPADSTYQSSHDVPIFSPLWALHSTALLRSTVLSLSGSSTPYMFVGFYYSSYHFSIHFPSSKIFHL